MYSSVCSYIYVITYRILFFFFFFNDTATTEIYTLSLHDALPISRRRYALFRRMWRHGLRRPVDGRHGGGREAADRKSTRLNSSHSQISYAVFCLKKKKKKKAKLKQVVTGMGARGAYSTAS